MDNPMSDVMDLEEQQKIAHEAALLGEKVYKNQLKNEPGLRYDAGKLRYDLIPPEVIEALAQVYTDGAKKYHDRNWEKGMSYSRLIRCIFSHLVKYIFGHRYDKDLPDCEHMAMVMWNAAAILTYDKRDMATEFNDLPHWRFEDKIIRRAIPVKDLDAYIPTGKQRVMFKDLTKEEMDKANKTGIITRDIPADEMRGDSITT